MDDAIPCRAQQCLVARLGKSQNRYKTLGSPQLHSSWRIRNNVIKKICANWPGGIIQLTSLSPGLLVTDWCGPMSWLTCSVQYKVCQFYVDCQDHNFQSVLNATKMRARNNVLRRGDALLALNECITNITSRRVFNVTS